MFKLRPKDKRNKLQQAHKEIPVQLVRRDTRTRRQINSQESKSDRCRPKVEGTQNTHTRQIHYKDTHHPCSYNF